MRYIDLDKIKVKVKKIKWKDVNKKHLEGLIYTDPKTGEEYISWEDIKKEHDKNIKALSIDERKKYISNNPDWNILQKIMIEEYGYKCWYSEAPIGNGEFEIDHYRPKNRARQDETTGKPNKENGYWWLAYDYENYRLSGALSNKRRRDRLKENSEVEGKGDLFPLDLEHCKVANDECSTFCEKPLLLDPVVSSDVGLLVYDEDGKILPNPLILDNFDRERAKISIKLYHLDLDQLETARHQVWTACRNAIENAYKYFTESDSAEAKKLAMKNCAEVIFEKTNLKSEFSSAAKSCVNTYRKLEGYRTIIDLLGL
jgi:hypothetical protein